jgi:hypothetical protein
MQRIRVAARRGDPRLGVVASIVAVAFVTGVIGVLDGFVPVLSLGALYVFAVLPIAILWGLAFAVGVSVARAIVAGDATPALLRVELPSARYHAASSASAGGW